MSYRSHPQVLRIPLWVEAVERQITRVASSDPAVPYPLPGELDRDVAGHPAVDERSAIVGIKDGVQDRDHGRVAGLVVQHPRNRPPERRDVCDVEVAREFVS